MNLISVFVPVIGGLFAIYYGFLNLESWIFRNDSNLRFYQTVTHDMIFIVLWKRNWSSSFETFLPIEINWSIRKIPFLFLIHIFGACERNFFLLPLGNFISFHFILVLLEKPKQLNFVNETRVFLFTLVNIKWLTLIMCDS